MDGDLSESFSIQQGVWQGAILSPPFYNTYLNPCLKELEQQLLGVYWQRVLWMSNMC